MKKNNILILVLVGLVLLFVTTNYFKKHSSAIFKAEVIQFDSSTLNKIIICPPSSSEEELIIISKDDNNWQVAQGTIKTLANQSTVNSVLGQLEQIKTEQLVSKTKEKWETYELTDTLALCVEIYQQGKEKPTKLYFGKTTNRQSQNPVFRGRPSVDASTYFRINETPSTYAIKGGLSNTFKRKFNAWRNTEFIKLNKDLITRLKFETNKNNTFSLSKKESDWFMGEISPDSTKVTQYLNTLSYQSSSRFIDGFKPKGNADYTLTIQGDSTKDLTIKAYRDSKTTKNYILNASQYPNVFIESDSTGLFKRLFVNRGYFLK